MVNDLFLKTLSCIDALGMILIIALMIYRPTSFMLATVFLGIQVIQFKTRRFFFKDLYKRHKEFLTALGLSPTVFLDPDDKYTLIIPKKTD